MRTSLLLPSGSPFGYFTAFLPPFSFRSPIWTFLLPAVATAPRSGCTFLTTSQSVRSTLSWSTFMQGPTHNRSTTGQFAFSFNCKGLLFTLLLDRMSIEISGAQEKGGHFYLYNNYQVLFWGFGRFSPTAFSRL